MRKCSFILAAAVAALAVSACGNQAGDNQQNAENVVIETIMSRRSIRQYKDTPVEREKLQLIAECGVNAPNGMNSQRWEVRIVDNPESLSAITEKFKLANPEMVARDANFKNMFRNAPSVIFIAVPNEDDGVNAGLMGENMIIAAQSMGLGTVCLGGPVNFLRNTDDGRAFLEKLGFSDGYRLLYMIGVGYPDETPDAKPRDLSKIRFID